MPVLQSAGKIVFGSVLALLLAVPAARAEDAHHASHAKDIYAPAMERMHKDMMITPTGDTDADFVRGMIPHHQGAIDMAKIVLEHGKDPEIRKLAEDVIAAQEKEIAQMKAWLEKHNQAK